MVLRSSFLSLCRRKAPNAFRAKFRRYCFVASSNALESNRKLESVVVADANFSLSGAAAFDDLNPASSHQSQNARTSKVKTSQYTFYRDFNLRRSGLDEAFRQLEADLTQKNFLNLHSLTTKTFSVLTSFLSKSSADYKGKDFVEFFAAIILNRSAVLNYRKLVAKFQTFDELNLKTFTTLNLLQVLELNRRLVDAYREYGLRKPWALLNELFSRLIALKDEEFLSFLYYVMEFGAMDERYVGLLEREIIKRADRFDVDDFALIAMSFFATHTQFKSLKVLELLCERLLSVEDFCSLSSVTLSSYFKILRKSQTEETELTSKILEKMCSASNKEASILLLAKCAHFAMRKNFFSPTFTEKVERRLYAANFDEIRSKDFSVLVHYFAHFREVNAAKCDAMLTFLSTKFFRDDSMQEFRQQFLVYPHQICSPTTGFVYANIYSEKLISLILSDQFDEMLKTAKYLNYWPDQDRFFIDCSISIERPFYNGPRLSEKFFQTFYDKNHGNFWFDENKTIMSTRMRTILPFAESTRRILRCPDEFIYTGRFLPHFDSPCIVFKMDRSRRVKPFPFVDSLHTIDRKMYKVDRNEKGIVILAASFGDRVWGLTTLTGREQCLRRQLMALGYKVIDIISKQRQHGTSIKQDHNFQRILESSIDEMVSRKMLNYLKVTF